MQIQQNLKTIYGQSTYGIHKYASTVVFYIDAGTNERELTYLFMGRVYLRSHIVTEDTSAGQIITNYGKSDCEIENNHITNKDASEIDKKVTFNNGRTINRSNICGCDKNTTKVNEKTYRKTKSNVDSLIVSITKTSTGEEIIKDPGSPIDRKITSIRTTNRGVTILN